MIAALRESKTRLSELVILAGAGEEVIIMVHGKPKARLVARMADCARALGITTRYLHPPGKRKGSEEFDC